MNVQRESSVRLLPDYETVRKHLPPRAWKYVLDLLQEHPVLVRVVPHRATKLGDYRPPRLGECWHRITVNEDLNLYAFLVTLLHELAHLRVTAIHATGTKKHKPHGVEWKKEFAAVVGPVIEESMVPRDLCVALAATLQRPRAATCSDRLLTLALSQYDHGVDQCLYVEQLEVGACFQLQNGRQFILGDRVRSRYRCIELASGIEFRIHYLARVLRLELD
ncbi:MAG TPA: sprT domain-containing protein [Planctomycetaceae bacterium]|nr:sprT domain-containing protein [Planctomycetaceae bacterium]